LPSVWNEFQAAKAAAGERVSAVIDARSEGSCRQDNAKLPQIRRNSVYVDFGYNDQGRCCATHRERYILVKQWRWSRSRAGLTAESGIAKHGAASRSFNQQNRDRQVDIRHSILAITGRGSEL